MNTQSSVDTRIKVGIIGFGRMGRFYWEAMTKSDRWNIAYICDTDPESRQLAKKLSPESLIVEDNQKIFEDESVQVVGLFTLADSRMEQIEKAIRYGKHIISEKPIADTMENEWKVVEMTENATRKYTPIFKEVKWLDNQEVCLMMNITKRTLQTYKDKGLLPYSKLNRKNYYKLSDVQALLEAGQPYNTNDNGFTDE